MLWANIAFLAGFDRDSKAEGAALAGFTIDPDFAAVRFHNLFADGEAEAEAGHFTVLFGAVVRLKQIFLRLHRNTLALVMHIHAEE